MQEFNLDTKFIWSLKALHIASLIMMFLMFALPFFPSEDGNNHAGRIVVPIFLAFLSGGYSLRVWLTLRNLPFIDLVTDNEGIWHKHLGKEQGLIPWEHISGIKERPYLQRLDLIDSSGKLLLKVEYRLLRFEALRSTIFENMDKNGPVYSRKEFKKGFLYHAYQISVALFFSIFGIFLGVNGHALVGFGGMGLMIAFIIYEYATTAYGVRINPNSFSILYPIVNRNIDYSDISEMGVVDEFDEAYRRLPEVWVVTLKSKKPFKLKKLGVESNILLSALQRALL
jgi:hypothetical protein